MARSRGLGDVYKRQDMGLTIDKVEEARRQGLEAIDKHKVDKIRLYANKLGLAEKQINQLFANKDSKRPASALLKELSGQPKGLFGSGILGLLPENAVSDVTAKRYVLDLEDDIKRTLASMGNDSITEADLHSAYKKAEGYAESKIQSKTDRSVIKKINEFASFNTTVGLLDENGRGSGTRKQFLIPSPQKTLQSLRPKIAKMFGFEDNYLEKTNVSLLKDQKSRALEIARTLDKEQRKIFNNQLIALSGNTDRQSRFKQYDDLLDEWEKNAGVAAKLDLAAAKTRIKPKSATKVASSIPSSTQSEMNISDLLRYGEAQKAKVDTNRKAGIIARLFGRRMAFGGVAKRTSQSRLLSALMKSSTVSTRMPSEHLLGMLGKGDTQYRSAFETGTGADYLTKYGTPNANQARTRRMMEKDAMGIDWNAPASERPTYGSVSLNNPVIRALAKIFGGNTGKQFAQVANPLSEQLDIYGDTSLIGKRSIGKRSKIFGNDILRSYVQLLSLIDI
jgi:hypothetical protein